MVLDRATVAVVGLTAVGVTGMMMIPRHNAETQQAFQQTQSAALTGMMNDFSQKNAELLERCALPPAPVIQTALSPGQTLIFTQPGAPPADGSPPPQSAVECLAPPSVPGGTSDAVIRPAPQAPPALKPDPGAASLSETITPQQLFDDLLRGTPSPGSGLQSPLIEQSSPGAAWQSQFTRRGFSRFGGGGSAGTFAANGQPIPQQRNADDDSDDGKEEPKLEIHEPGTFILVGTGLAILVWRGVT